MPTIKNIILDFGGVLLNLDESLTENRLKDLLDLSLCENINEEVFYPYERGEISEEAFFNRLQRRSTKVYQGDLYYEIWSAMLLDFPDKRLAFLEEIKSRFNLYLLSNTNITHVRNVYRKLKNENGVSNFEEYFDGVYLSHEIHLRKPDSNIYQYVLQDAKINAAESLFIDDKLENIEGAKSCGINVYHHNPKTEIVDIFEKILASFNE